MQHHNMSINSYRTNNDSIGDLSDSVLDSLYTYEVSYIFLKCVWGRDSLKQIPPLKAPQATFQL